MKEKKYIPINLSRNVFFDKKTNLKIKNILKKTNSFLHYGEPVYVYKAISKYYGIPFKRLTIGFGATDIINRLLRILEIKNLYIVKPSFEATEVYCKINNINPININAEKIYQSKKNNSALYIVNPNGNDGLAFKIEDKVFKFYKYIIVDEVYGDFAPKVSMLKKNHSKLIVIKSLSKSLGLAGLRVGFCKAPVNITKRLQNTRITQVCSSFASVIVPKIITSSKNVIRRMNISKKYLEKKYDCKKSHSNFVLFKKKNNLTKKFGFKKVDKYYRMALADLDTIKSNE